ncbi:uncharacterized protein TRIADDRAFT_52060 [Trichoplax adhaerens]|uniref:SRCR domain-containing protein n=1 Tax=Trichoplax adhaerens TaxID=10228 RepID=B3RLN0_TRIAD|nr:hypothetical protein TRIADDRAFT_52060 [Trichoplax adhaerens]EDV28811.1 hypothetical protein TRIADDRAFT_52060 [Trichoplax adhaerens]|eukprot:XP_002108013.1 hypothetical protein TRIADDRAFT_52060 [Trichoplax adhaerens]
MNNKFRYLIFLIIVLYGNNIRVFSGNVPGIAVSPIRIVDGFTQYSGRIEIYHANKWGSICSNGWGIKEANVACRQLNYAKAMSAKASLRQESLSKQSWTGFIACQGNEIALSQCEQSQWIISAECTSQSNARISCEATADNPLNCIFEHGFCSWKQPKRNYKMDWLWTDSNHTPLNKKFSGPHIFLNTLYGNDEEEATLRSPLLMTPYQRNITVTFNYHQSKIISGAFTVEVFTKVSQKIWQADKASPPDDIQQRKVVFQAPAKHFNVQFKFVKGRKSTGVISMNAIKIQGCREASKAIYDEDDDSMAMGFGLAALVFGPVVIFFCWRYHTKKQDEIAEANTLAKQVRTHQNQTSQPRIRNSSGGNPTESLQPLLKENATDDRQDYSTSQKLHDSESQDEADEAASWLE